MNTPLFKDELKRTYTQLPWVKYFQSILPPPPTTSRLVSSLFFEFAHLPELSTCPPMNQLIMEARSRQKPLTLTLELVVDN